MIRIYVDFNNREGLDEIIVKPGGLMNENIDARNLRDGDRVVLYDEGDEYEAILHPGKSHPWIGKAIFTTHRSLRPTAESN